MQNNRARATAKKDQSKKAQSNKGQSNKGQSKKGQPAKGQPAKGQPPDPVSPAAPKVSAKAQLTGGPKPPAAAQGAVDEQVAAALMDLDLEGAQRRSRRVGPTKMINVPVQLKDHAAAERANRATLDEIAASLGISRSAMNRILDEPQARLGGKHQEHKHSEHKGGNKRHPHGTGRRRHAG